MTLLFLLLAILSLSDASGFPQAITEARPFIAGGSLRISVKTGHLKISKGTDSQRIVLAYVAESADQPGSGARVPLRFETSGSQGIIEFTVPEGGSVDAAVQVPSPTDLTVKVEVGENEPAISVGGVDGNKDFRVEVGDIELDVGPNPSYARINLSSAVGRINESILGRPRISLGLTGEVLKKRGPGQYLLKAHTAVGDIRISPKQTLKD